MIALSSEKLEIIKAVESRQQKFWKMSDAIWSYAYLGLEKYKSSKLVADTVDAYGFTVEREVAEMPTSLVASWSNGTGKPVIGFLGEYDALPMLSQKAGSPTKEPVVPGAPGHGCSHNTMCAVQGLATTALKEIMDKTAHSGTSPWMGRSAVDAVELMHAGTERMREHLPITQRMHWVTLEGEEAPNMVPDRASTWYYIRDVDENVENNFKWALDCARGASLMTQTSYEVKLLAAVNQKALFYPY